MRILFTNAGRRTYMMEFALQLNVGNGDVEVIASDCDPTAPALHVPGIRPHLLPPVLADPTEYRDRLRDFIAQETVEIVIPLSDLDLDILAECREDLRSTGCVPIISAPETIERCANKQVCYEFCRRVGLPTPETKFHADEGVGLPSIIKPIRGSGSADIRRANDSCMLGAFDQGVHLIQRWIDGNEYGVDILNDLEGRFVSTCIKRKILMRAGETDRAAVEDHPRLHELARRISSDFSHVGNLDVDVMEARDGSLFCLDFNPRFGGGYAATHLAGMNYLQAVCDMARGKSVELPESPRPLTVMKGISVYSTGSAR